MDQSWAMAVMVVAVFVVFILFFSIWASRYRRAGPNEALIIWGRREGVRIVVGGGTFVWPVLEQVQRLSLEVAPVEFRIENVQPASGRPAAVGGIAQAKIQCEPDDIRRAAEWLLSKTPAEIAAAARLLVEDGVQAAARKFEGAYMAENRDAFAREILAASAPALARMGLTLISVQVREVAQAEAP